MTKKVVAGRERVEETLRPVGAALDRWAWIRLRNTHADLAAAVQAAVDGGAQPDELRRYVMEHTGRSELAGFVEQAARWLVASADQSTTANN